VPHLAVPIRIGTGRQVAEMAAHSRLLLVLGFEGRVLRAQPTGTWINGQYRWAATRAWAPVFSEPLDPRTAAATLARSWLRAYGPGTRADLQWWADRIREWQYHGKEVFVYFNNDGAGNAVHNAATLRSLLACP